METMNVAIPEVLKNFVQTRVAEGGYSSVSEYIRELIRADQKQRAREVLETEIRRGIESGPAVPMTSKEWDSIRAEVRKRHAARSGKKQ